MVIALIVKMLNFPFILCIISFIFRQKSIKTGSKEQKLSPVDVKFLDESGEEVDPSLPREVGAMTNMQFELNAGDRKDLINLF